MGDLSSPPAPPPPLANLASLHGSLRTTCQGLLKPSLISQTASLTPGRSKQVTRTAQNPPLYGRSSKAFLYVNPFQIDRPYFSISRYYWNPKALKILVAYYNLALICILEHSEQLLLFAEICLLKQLKGIFWIEEKHLHWSKLHFTENVIVTLRAVHCCNCRLLITHSALF